MLPDNLNTNLLNSNDTDGLLEVTSLDILDKIEAFIFIFDLKSFKPLWINRYTEKRFHCTNEELQKLSSDTFLSLFHPRSLLRFTSRIKNYERDNPQGTKTVYQVKTLKGEWINMHTSSIVFKRDENNNIKCLMGYATEVSHRELGENMRQMKELDSSLKQLSLIESLSKRERDVVYYIAHGYTDREIGKILNISMHTTKTHRKRILNKLHMKNSALLIKFAVENGLAL